VQFLDALLSDFADPQYVAWYTRQHGVVCQCHWDTIYCCSCNASIEENRMWKELKDLTFGGYLFFGMLILLIVLLLAGCATTKLVPPPHEVYFEEYCNIERGTIVHTDEGAVCNLPDGTVMEK
jgi:hypothetical protein